MPRFIELVPSYHPLRHEMFFQTHLTLMKDESNKSNVALD